MPSAAPIDPLAKRSSSDPDPLPVYVVAPVCAASLGLASGCVQSVRCAGLNSAGSSRAQSTPVSNISPRMPIAVRGQSVAGTTTVLQPLCGARADFGRQDQGLPIFSGRFALTTPELSHDARWSSLPVSCALADSSGIRRGARSAVRLGGWTAAFLCLSEGLQRAAVSPWEDRLRDAAGRLLVPSGVPEATGAASAGALAVLGHRFCALFPACAADLADRLPRGGSNRRYAYALLLGLVTGGVQDLQAQVRRWQEPQREV